MIVKDKEITNNLSNLKKLGFQDKI